MNNIDFIKWMCDKAGFSIEIRSLKTGTEIYITVDNNFPGVNIHSGFYEIYIAPLLLQRAIEGVNKNSKYFTIFQNYKYIAVTNRKSFRHLMQTDSVSDKAKESALRYIYEQEAPELLNA